MANWVQTLGDSTSHSVKPDFDSEKGYHWMKQVKALKEHGTPLKQWPTKPRRGLAETTFFSQVDRHLSRKSFSPGVSFDTEGKIIRHG